MAKKQRSGEANILQDSQTITAMFQNPSRQDPDEVQLFLALR
jgi:hypothetical protein